MVDKKPAKDVNKSAEIRRIAAAMKEKGEKPRPVVIIAQAYTFRSLNGDPVTA